MMLYNGSWCVLTLPGASWQISSTKLYFLTIPGFLFGLVLATALHYLTWNALFTLLLMLPCSLLQNRQSKLSIFLTVLVTSLGASLLYNNNTDRTGD